MRHAAFRKKPPLSDDERKFVHRLLGLELGETVLSGKDVTTLRGLFEKFGIGDDAQTKEKS